MKLADAMKTGYKSRIENCVRTILEHEPESEPTGLLALAHYYLGAPEMKQRAEAVIYRTAMWFADCPYIGYDGNKRPTRGECDFAAARLARVLVRGQEGLSEKTRGAIRDFFTKNDFESMYKSENHMLIFHTARYIAASTYSAEMFEPYRKHGAELAAEDAEFLDEYIVYRAKNGWGEFDSVGYMCEDLIALCLLYDFAEGRLKTLAQMAADQLLLDMLADEARGLYCGAHGRIYEDQALDHICGAMLYVHGLYFGNPYLDSAYVKGKIEGNFEEFADFAELAMTGYFPSDFVFAAAAEKPCEYENYESKNLHSITCPTPHKRLPPERGHISKYTYITRDYALGSVCFQDKYENPEGAWYAHHQQHEWELTFLDDTRAKIFTHHPGGCGAEGHEHGYWTGDLMCCCGSFFTHKNVALAMYDIPEGEEDEINANVLFELYEIREDGKYIFLKHGRVYASLYFSEGYYRKSDGAFPERELRARGRRQAVVCIAATEAEYGSFDNFIARIKATELVFDKENMSLSCGGLYMDKTTRKIDGRTVSFPYPTFENPFMHSESGSGVIRIFTAEGTYIMDFENARVDFEGSVEK